MEDEKNFDRKQGNFRVSKPSELEYLPASLSAGCPERLTAGSVLTAAGLFWKIVSRLV